MRTRLLAAAWSVLAAGVAAQEPPSLPAPTDPEASAAAT